MHGVLDGYVERGEVPGLVALVARRGGLHVHVAGSTSVGGRPLVVVLRAPRAARAAGVRVWRSGDGAGGLNAGNLGGRRTRAASPQLPLVL
jgi:hypothetical protein